MTARNNWLLVAGSLSFAAALLHLACIAGGPAWYRAVGAPEPLIGALERGNPALAYMTAGIALVLAIWGAYAFAGAGLIRRLPLMRTALLIISAIYLARGLMIVDPQRFTEPGRSSAFMLWTSLIVLMFGLTYAIGTWRAWSALSAKKV